MGVTMVIMAMSMRVIMAVPGMVMGMGLIVHMHGYQLLYGFAG